MAADSTTPPHTFFRRHMFDADGAVEIQKIRTAGGKAIVHCSRSPCKVAESPDSEPDDNQDAAAVVNIGSSRSVLIIADGAGGYASGASAAAIAVTHLVKHLPTDRTPDPDSGMRGAILDGFDDANSSVLDIGIGAATTLLAVEIHRDKIRAYNVGDSQAVLIGQRGKVRMETTSHSPVGYGVQAGLIHADDALAHDDRHLVSNLIGVESMHIEIGSAVTMQSRDTLLLGSDGVFDNIPLTELFEIVRKGPLEQAGRNLATICRKRMTDPAEGQPSKPDDISFILFRSG